MFVALFTLWVTIPPQLYFEDTAPQLSRLGKPLAAMLPEEVLLVQFISNLTNTDRSWRATKKNIFQKTKVVSACTWRGVQCTSESRVQGLWWNYFNLSGEPNWHFLPAHLRDIDLSFNKLTGEVPFSILPPTVRILYLQNNLFFGELHLKELPFGLRSVQLQNNEFIKNKGFADECPESLMDLQY